MPDGGDDMQPAVHAPQPAEAGLVKGSNVIQGLQSQSPQMAVAVAAIAAPEAVKQSEAAAVAAAAAVVVAAAAAATPAVTVAVVEGRGEGGKREGEAENDKSGVSNDAASLLAEALAPSNLKPKPAAPTATAAAAIVKPERPGASPAHVQGGSTGEKKVSVHIYL